jgi:hypothetical protein
LTKVRKKINDERRQKDEKAAKKGSLRHLHISSPDVTFFSPFLFSPFHHTHHHQTHTGRQQALITGNRVHVKPKNSSKPSDG